MGINLEGKDTFQEDKTYVDGETKIPVEIKGHEGSITLKDLRQSYSRIPNAKIPNKSTPKTIFIGNPYRLTRLIDRKIDFEPNMVEEAEKWDLCLLSTRVIWKYYIDFLETGKSNLKEKIITTIGLLK